MRLQNVKPWVYPNNFLYIIDEASSETNIYQNIHKQTCQLQAGDVKDITRTKKKQTPWPLVRKRTIPTERLQLVDEI
jgi:hypothetical protein